MRISRSPRNWLIAAAALVAATGLTLAGPQGGRRMGPPPDGPRGMAGHHQRGPGQPLLRMLDRLDLSDAQRSQIEVLTTQRWQQNREVREQLRESRRAAFEAARADVFDERAVRKAATEAALAEVELTVERARTMREIRDILTPEQREKLDAMHEERQRRGPEGRGPSSMMDFDED